jgi:hypothetical protein
MLSIAPTTSRSAGFVWVISRVAGGAKADQVRVLPHRRLGVDQLAYPGADPVGAVLATVRATCRPYSFRLGPGRRRTWWSRRTPKPGWDKRYR